MKKISLIVLLLTLTLYSGNNIIILNKEKDSGTVDILIKGNGEQCSVSINADGIFTRTNCLQLTNSKNVKILCTPKKKICKSQQELQEAAKHTKHGTSKVYSKNLKEYSNSIFRFSVKYPAELLTEKHLDAEGYGAWLQTDEEGTVQVKVNGIYAMEIQDAKQAYREAINRINEDSNNRNEITYKVQKENWFLLSGYNHKNKTIFYEKRYFLKGNETKNADIIVGFRISYPVRDKKKYDKLVSTINENFKYYNDYTIKGNGEQCTVSIDNTGVLIETNCLQLRNSKKIDILCTKNKKICKTVSEVRDALSGASSSKGPDFSLPSKLSNITPSFDCTRASTGTEYDICRSDKVATLDSELGNIYLKIKNDMPLEDFRSLIEIQKEWINDRDHKCSTQSNFAEREKCLIEFYQKRMEAFNLISVMDSQMNYSYSYSDIYEHGTSQDRFELSAYIYYQENDIKKATKLLRKIIADKQENFIDAFFALQDIHEDYIKEFPQISEKLLGENHGSIGASLMDLNATHDKVIDVLIKEAYLLDAYAEIMLMVKYQYPVKDQPFHDKRILSFYSECAKEGIPRCEEFLGRIYLNGWGVKQNTDKGIKLLKQSELGDAYMALAEYYYEKNDIENSKKYYKKASELGEYKATYNLGVFAQDAKKYKKAIDYFNAVLEENDKYYPAMLELSRMFIEGWGTEPNYKKAIDLLQKVIDNSDDIEIQELAIGNLSIAEYQLGLKYLTSKDSNKTKAFILIEKSAKSNNMYAQYELAKMYFNGDGVKKNEEQVIKWYMKAAEQGHPEAQLYLAVRYLKGTGIEKDHAKGLNWAKRSAESGYPKGQAYYGVLLLEENDDKAMEWLEKAAKQGNKVAKDALRELAVRLNSIAIPSKSHSFKKALKVYEDKSKEEAFPLMLSLAKQGDPDAQAYLGEMYDFGYGIKKDKSQAKIWYEKAASQNNAMGMYGLGRLIDYGNRQSLITPPIGQARIKAIKWYEKSAALGYADAASGLAYLYSKLAGDNYESEKAIYWAEQKAKLGTAFDKMYVGGKFVDEIWFPKDLEKSHYWFKKAYDEFLISADNGDGYTQSIIGSMNYYGQGVPKNIQKAIKYLETSLTSKDTYVYYDTTRLLEIIEKETSYNNDNRIKRVDNVFGIVIGDKVSNVTQKKIPTGDIASLELSMDIEMPRQAKELGFERAVLTFTPNEKRIVSLTVSSKENSKNKKIFDNVKRLLEEKYGIFLYNPSKKGTLSFEKKVNDIIIKILLVDNKGISLQYMSESYNQLLMKEISEFKWADKYGL